MTTQPLQPAVGCVPQLPVKGELERGSPPAHAPALPQAPRSPAWTAPSPLPPPPAALPHACPAGSLRGGAAGEGKAQVPAGRDRNASRHPPPPVPAPHSVQLAARAPGPWRAVARPPGGARAPPADALPGPDRRALQEPPSRLGPTSQPTSPPAPGAPVPAPLSTRHSRGVGGGEKEAPAPGPNSVAEGTGRPKAPGEEAARRGLGAKCQAPAEDSVLR